MKRVQILLFTLAALMSQSAVAEDDVSNPLERFRWDFRILLIAASGDQLTELVSQLEAQKAAIEERHLLWFVLTRSDLRTNYQAELPPEFASAVREKYFEGKGMSPEVRLIGKDGGIKARQTKLELDKIYQRIDAMPMRRAEMRAQRD